MDTSVIVLLVVLAIVAISVLVIYNGIIGGSNRAQRAWSDVLVYERQKTEVLDALQENVASFQAYEAQLQTEITRLRGAIDSLPREANGAALASVERGTKDLFAGLRVAFEAYPDLKASEVMNNLMREIAEQQENVGAAIAIFNAEVETFNNAIQMFPGSLVNGALNKKQPIVNFSDEQASSRFDYKPNF